MSITDRELATAIWVFIAVALIVRSPKLRGSLEGLVRTATHRLILLPVLLVTVYVWGETRILTYVGLWDSSHTFKTWIWTFSAGVASIYAGSQTDDPSQVIKGAIAKNFKISVVLTFLLNSNPFPLALELILIPALVFIGGLQAVADIQVKKDDQYKPVKRLIDNSLALFGVIVLIYVAYSVYRDFAKFATWETPKKFLVPIELSILFVPLLYYFALLTSYERLFIRLKAFVQDEEVRRLVAALVLLKCQVNLWRVALWSRLLPGINVESTRALLESLRFSRPSGTANPPERFRGLEWGSPPASYMKLLTGPDEEGAALYCSPDWPPMPQFGYRVAEECYSFQDERLYGVTIFLDGRAAFDAGRYELQALYGPATFVNARGDLLRWNWTTPQFEFMLWYDNNHDRVTLNATNEDISTLPVRARGDPVVDEGGSIGKSRDINQ